MNIIPDDAKSFHREDASHFNRVTFGIKRLRQHNSAFECPCGHSKLWLILSAIINYNPQLQSNAINCVPHPILTHSVQVQSAFLGDRVSRQPAVEAGSVVAVAVVVEVAFGVVVLRRIADVEGVGERTGRYVEERRGDSHADIMSQTARGCQTKRQPRVHRAIYTGRLVYKGKTEIHIYPTICDLIRIFDTERQKRIRARNRAPARLMARKCRRVRNLRLHPPPLPRHQPSVFRSRMRHRNSPFGRRTRSFGQRMILKFRVVRPKGEFP